VSKDVLKPREPTRQEILDTFNDRGLKHYRNPTHLAAVKDSWPKPQTEEAKNEHRIMKMEMHPSYRNGSIRNE
jgi:hypothetical protein